MADPRAPWQPYGQYGVIAWDQPSATLTSQRSPGQGRFAVADPRMPPTAAGRQRFANVYRVVPWTATAPTVTAGQGPSAGGLAVADPRCSLARRRGDAYVSGGHYGVVPWTQTAGAVTAAAGHDNGRWSVADPRLPAADETDDPTAAGPPAPETKCVAVIRTLDGTWHRPFTTLDLAALQGLVDPETFAQGEPWKLTGQADGRWRERIGNAVPPPAATAIASVMGRTLLLAWSGETFILDAAPIWVRKLAAAVAFDNRFNLDNMRC